jgi:hypothetical protein
MELSAALRGLNIPILDFIGGLGGSDITFNHFEWAIDKTVESSAEEPSQNIYWFGLD